MSQAGADWGRLYYSTDMNASALLAGAALAMFGVPPLRHGRALGLAAMAVLLVLCLTMTGRTEAGRTALVMVGFPLAIAASVILIAAAMNSRSGWLAMRPLVFLGGISYGLYLWHTGLNTMADVDYGMGVTARLVIVPLSIFIAYASWRLWETRFRSARQQTELDDSGFVPEAGSRGGSVQVDAPLQPDLALVPNRATVLD
jgi:peptidoglycan/LPS O-acetylase OafA/YrhL